MNAAPLAAAIPAPLRPPAPPERDTTERDASLKAPESEFESLNRAMASVKQSVYALCFARGLFPEAQVVFAPGALALRVDRASHGGGVDDAAAASDAVDFARARTLNSWLDDGVRECVAKKYCRTAAFTILDESDRALEVYAFKFSYPSSESVVVDAASHETMKNELSFFATVLPPLAPTAASIAIKMTFTSSAPPNFVPTGFEPCAAADLAFDAAAVQSTIRLALGKARGIHTCSLVYQGPPPPLEEEEEEEEEEASRGDAADAARRDYSLVDTYSGKNDSAPVSQSQDSYIAATAPANWSARARAGGGGGGVPVVGSQDSYDSAPHASGGYYY